MNQSLYKLNRFSKALLPLCIVFLLSCNSNGRQQDKKTEEATEAPAAREAFVLKKGRLSSSLQIPGELIAFQQVDLYAKENSFVKKLYVDVGSQVSSGQLLG